MEYSLLRVCLGLQKMTCVLRNTPPDILFPILHDFDSFMFHCINDLVGGALSDWSRLKASLPPRLGGLGIRRVSAHSGAIFLSSVRACSPLILALSIQVAPHSYTSSAFSSFCSFANLSDISSPEDLDVSLCRSLSPALLTTLLSIAYSPHLLLIIPEPFSSPPVSPTLVTGLVSSHLPVLVSTFLIRNSDSVSVTGLVSHCQVIQ